MAWSSAQPWHSSTPSRRRRRPGSKYEKVWLHCLQLRQWWSQFWHETTSRRVKINKWKHRELLWRGGCFLVETWMENNMQLQGTMCGDASLISFLAFPNDVIPRLFKVVNTCASRTQAWLINLRWCCALLNRTWSCCACYAVLAAGSCRPILPVLLLCSPSYTETFKNQDIVHERRNTKLQVHIYGLLCLGEASLKHCSLNPSHHMFMSVVSSTARSWISDLNKDLIDFESENLMSNLH